MKYSFGVLVLAMVCNMGHAEDLPYDRPWFDAFQKSHPVLWHYSENSSRLKGEMEKGAIKRFMDVTDEQLRQLIPTQSGQVDCRCPACGKGDRWQLDLTQLDKLHCTGCDARFPNAKFPENHTEQFTSYFGKKIKVSYYKDGKGTLHCFSGKLNQLKMEYLTNYWTQAIGLAYQATDDESYARRARNILVGLARNAEGFLYAERGRYEQLYSWPRERKVAPAFFPKGFHPDSNKNAPFHCGVFPTQQSAYQGLIDLYDLTYSSECYDEVVDDGNGGKHSARQLIDAKFFGRIPQYLEAATACFGWEPHCFNNTGNIVSQYKVPGRIAKVTGRWDHIRFIRELVLTRPMDAYRIGYDRVSLEGPGYHACWLGSYLLSARDLMTMNYPPEARSIRDEFISTDGYGELVRNPNRVDLPNMYHPALNDDHQPTVPSNRWKKHGTCDILPSFGHAMLGDGEGKGQVQVNLDFSQLHNHGHRDSLTMMLFAYGHDLYPDIGANYTDGGIWNWGASTLGHNTVTVNRKNQNEKWGEGGGDLELFQPNLPGLALIRANSSRVAYKGIAKTYRRTVILNTVEMKRSYVLDVFEVEGGSTHDYSLNGSCYDYAPQTASCSIELKDMAGEMPLLEEGDGWSPPGRSFAGMKDEQLYGFFRKVKTAKADKNGYVEFKYTNEPKAGSRTHFAADDKMDIFLGETPSLNGRPYWKKLKDLPLTRFKPHLLLRRRDAGAKDLKSLFVLLHEPIEGDPVVKDFKWERLDGGISVVVSLTGGRTDHYILSLDDAKDRSVGKLKTNGILGAATTRGKESDLWLVGGTYVSFGSKQVKQSSAAVEGDLWGVGSKRFGSDEHFILTDAAIPVDEWTKGELALLEFLDKDHKRLWTSGFEILRVEESNGLRKLIVRDDPYMYLRGDHVEEHYYPYRKARSCRVRLTCSKSSVPQVRILPNTGRYDVMQVNDHVPFLDSQKVLFSVSDGKTAVHATADGSDPMTAQAAISGGMTLTKTAMVKAVVANPGGVMAPRVSSQRFVAMLPAAKESAEGLVSGLTLTHFQGEEAFREAARSTDQNQQPSTAVQGFDLGPFGRGHVAVLEGYLDVPETGVYNFVSLSYPGINLILDNEKIIEAYGRGDTAWWVQDGRIGLAKGLHRIRIEYHNPTSHPGEVNIEWQGPSTEGGKIPESKLFHK